MAEPKRKERPAAQLLQGNVAAAEAAIRAGCRFFAGYPITPSSEIMVRMAELLRERGGAFMQMEDEIASICAVAGASWSGAKAMTATSGPGFSLMQEGLGYAYFTETPLVLIDVQRAGPATGQATHVAQGDVMQFRYGSHGDLFPIALVPWSVQEMYDLTIRAFNLAERFRTPVFLAADEAVGHLRENAVLHDDYEVVDRVRFGDGDPFGSADPAGVPVMPAFGDGRALMVTGSTHDPKGFRKVDDPNVHDALVTRLMRKVMDHADEIVEVDAHLLDDAEIGIVAYGISARTSIAAVKRLRAKGVKAGLLRLKTLWPFPEREIARLGERVRAIVVPELNKGMIAGVVRGCTRARVLSITQTNGKTIDPSRVVRFAEEMS
ncbi:MAG: 2-oxoacid:acceptor oxidoreductase subunit alpha [Proteobacteria bacterium]|jgi:2-oxoglutarate ferredoxin oxidoreductase subunit alpha|nr:2-oxoacid:acceptor oxidoreductase subunit alpha [Pseudomonadota bacterium]